ncbi:MAG TPA: DUF1800 domain-containing protein [Candidatus Kapabacteria bacterium]|nr:DUF1800 domain-containing protein [Candidatus Kapabacteria bacterium]
MDRRNFLTIGTPRVRSNRTANYVGGAGTQTLPVFASRTAAGLEPYSGPWSYTQAAHLLRRCMVGPTEAEILKAVSDGMSATVDNLLKSFTPDLTAISDWAGTDAVIKPDAAPTDPDYTTKYTAWQTEMFRRRAKLVAWWQQTIATSKVSIQERMTLFWHNHFTSEMQTVNFAEFMYTQNQLLRTSMLGNLKQFTKDVSKDMAMLIYLDGVKNFKRGNRVNINENYARELQELFTMGVTDWDGNPNYTQTDVSEAARALSGWTFTTSTQGANYAGLSSQFVASSWDNGSKTFLGQTGNWKMDDIVDIIFAQRGDQVAKFVCGKLYRAFVYDTMDRDVVTAMAATLKGGNWELKPVLDQLLRSAHFYDDTNIGALEKSPVEYMIGMIRSLNLGSVPDFAAQAQGRVSQDLGTRLTNLGMTLLDPPNVKGWPGGRTWISTSTLPQRQKFGIDVANGALKLQRAAIYTLDAVAFAKTFPDPGDIHKLSADMANFLLNTPPSDMEATTLYNTLLDGGVDYEWDINDPNQNPGARITKFLVVLFQLAKYQLY